jgi:hypothetical protein
MFRESAWMQVLFAAAASRDVQVVWPVVGSN